MIFKKARRHLKKNDKVLGKRINAVGICTLTPLKRDHFDVLVSSIISLSRPIKTIPPKSHIPETTILLCYFFLEFKSIFFIIIFPFNL